MRKRGVTYEAGQVRLGHARVHGEGLGLDLERALLICAQARRVVLFVVGEMEWRACQDYL